MKVDKLEKEGTALDLDDILGKPKNRVALVGIELEGGWMPPPQGIAVLRDGSVFKQEGDNGGTKRDSFPGAECGEIQIGPWQVVKIAPALKKVWPHIIDSTCGLHVHQSFATPYHYLLLADSPAYQETILKYLTKWAQEEEFPKTNPIWERLSGKSIYCQKKFWPQEQMTKGVKDHDQQRFGHRYTAVNYCYERFSTVEVRVLPMPKTVEVGIRGIRRIIDITNAYLLKTEKTRVKEQGQVKLATKEGTKLTLKLKSGAVYEEFTED